MIESDKNSCAVRSEESFLVRLDPEGAEVKVETKGTCQDCKWWIEQGPRTKDIDFQLTVVGWCKRMPRTEMDKDKDDWCGEFEPR